MIREFSDLCREHRRQLFELTSAVSREAFFPDEGAMSAKYGSEYYEGGDSYFTLWDDGRVVAALGVITREIPERGEAFISGVYVPEGKEDALRLLLARALLYLLPFPVRELKLGISGALEHLRRPLEELGFDEVYTTVQLLHRGGSDLPASNPDLDIVMLPLQAGNAGEYRRVHNAAFARSPNGATLSSAGVRELIESDSISGLCLDNGEAVGVYDIRTAGDTGWIEGLAVHPDHQGRGLGGDLLVRLVDRLYRAGCREVRLHVVSSNEQALKLYTSRGFDREKVLSRWFEVKVDSPAF